MKACSYCDALRRGHNIVLRLDTCYLISLATPHQDREDGGHLIAVPKRHISNRTGLHVDESVELFYLTILAGEALQQVLTGTGVKIGNVNYQENGNWLLFEPEGNHMHIHIYGRACNSPNQVYGQSLRFAEKGSAVYGTYSTLTENDINMIVERIQQSREGSSRAEFERVLSTLNQSHS